MRERTVARNTPECSKRPSSKAAASEGVRRTLRYVERLSEARTPLEDFFSILLGRKVLCQRLLIPFTLPLLVLTYCGTLTRYSASTETLRSN